MRICNGPTCNRLSSDNRFLTDSKSRTLPRAHLAMHADRDYLYVFGNLPAGHASPLALEEHDYAHEIVRHIHLRAKARTYF
jgi:hypothetical protein